MALVTARLPDLVQVVDDPRAVEDLRRYFEPGRAVGTAPRYSGSRFEFFGGGGDRVEVVDRIAPDDLLAVTLLDVHVPGDVALQLFEGELGIQVERMLTRIPADVGIDSPAAVGLLAAGSPARLVFDLLAAPHGMGWVTTHKLLARKRPRLIPVYDRVVRCALGRPEGFWNWLVGMFAADGGVLPERLAAARSAAGVLEDVSLLRVLDVVLWMRHRDAHRKALCS